MFMILCAVFISERYSLHLLAKRIWPKSEKKDIQSCREAAAYWLQRLKADVSGWNPS